MTDQPRQESPSGESGQATDPANPTTTPTNQAAPERSERPDQPGRRDQYAPRRPQGPVDHPTRWALSLGGAALLLMVVFPPAAPVPAAAALVVGVRARRRARRAGGVASRGAVAGIVMGSVGLLVSIPLATTQILLWGELHRYLDCRQVANTISDQQVCKDTFLNEVEKKFNLREGSLRHYNLPM